VQVRDGAIPLAYQSRDVGNVQVFYEKYGLSARLASTIARPISIRWAAARQPTSTPTAMASSTCTSAYQIVPQFTVFGDATNLTDAPWRRYKAASPVDRARALWRELRGGVQVHFDEAHDG
jgi:Flp pilus assembly secretin CpaC